MDNDGSSSYQSRRLSVPHTLSWVISLKVQVGLSMYEILQLDHVFFLQIRLLCWVSGGWAAFWASVSSFYNKEGLD